MRRALWGHPTLFGVRWEAHRLDDTLIAAHALALDATLVTNNTAEFARVPGLRCENWAA